jgi:hypothetical protein
MPPEESVPIIQYAIQLAKGCVERSHQLGHVRAIGPGRVLEGDGPGFAFMCTPT